MTVYLAFDMVKQGRVKLDQMVTVRPETWERWHGPKAGSTMFLSPNQQVSVRDLLYGIITVSGNDACVVLAEGLQGTEQARSEEHTSELQSLMRNSYAVFCLKKKKHQQRQQSHKYEEPIRKMPDKSTQSMGAKSKSAVRRTQLKKD